MVTECPKCQAKKPEWNGARCAACGFQGRYFQKDKSHYQWPFYKRIRGLFGAVILDESQVAKSKTSQVGQAVRALEAKGRLVLSGTPMKGYVTDLFWTTGWLLGYGSPLWPFPYQRGIGQVPAPVRHVPVRHQGVRGHLDDWQAPADPGCLAT